MVTFDWYTGLHAFYELLTVSNFMMSVMIIGFIVYMLKTEKDPLRWGLLAYIIPSLYFTLFYGFLFVFDLEDNGSGDQFVHAFSRPGVTTLLLGTIVFLFILKIRLNFEKERREKNEIKGDIQ